MPILTSKSEDWTMTNKLQSITHEEINHLPLFAYKGAVELISDTQSADTAIAEINRHPLVGFDTETRPAFVRGTVYKVALAQVATPDKVYLFRLHHTGITDSMHAFFENTLIIKAGIALRDDLKALQKIRNFTPNNFFDVASMSKEAGLGATGVKKLAAILLKVRISDMRTFKRIAANFFTPVAPSPASLLMEATSKKLLGVKFLIFCKAFKSSRKAIPALIINVFSKKACMESVMPV